MGKSSKKPRKEEESDSGSQDESETEVSQSLCSIVFGAPLMSSFP